jgi:hypothetical protein
LEKNKIIGIMQNKLQELTEKLYSEGLSKEERKLNESRLMPKKRLSRLFLMRERNQNRLYPEPTKRLKISGNVFSTKSRCLPGKVTPPQE